MLQIALGLPSRITRSIITYSNGVNSSIMLGGHLPGGPKKWYLSYNVIYVREVSLFLAHPVCVISPRRYGIARPPNVFPVSIGRIPDIQYTDTAIGVILGGTGTEPHFFGVGGRTPHFISTPSQKFCFVPPHFSDQSYATGCGLLLQMSHVAWSVC